MPAGAPGARPTPASKATGGAVPANPNDPAKADFDQALAAIRTELDAAVDVHDHRLDSVTADIASTFDAARSAVDGAVASARWADAKAALPALQAAAAAMRQADADHTAYVTGLAALVDYPKAKAAIDGPRVPAAVFDPFKPLYDIVEGSRATRAWRAGIDAMPKAEAAAAAIVKVLAAGKVYYDAYEAGKVDLLRGSDAFFDEDSGADKLASLKFALREAVKLRMKALQAGQWADAKDALETERKAGLELADALDALKAIKAPFSLELAKLKNLDLARETALKAAKKVRDAEGQAFLEKYAVMNDARNLGSFDVATTALPPLQIAIDALLAANTADFNDRLAFEIDRAALGDLRPSRTLAAAPPAPLANQAAAWMNADKAVADAAGTEDWAAARICLAALRIATTTLRDAQANFNKGASPADNAAFTKQLLALKPRIDAAADATQPTYVMALQAAVRERVAGIGVSLKSKDLAAAQAAFDGLTPALVAMEKAKADASALKARFDAARDGEVKKARDLALQPAELGTTRDHALDATEAAIAAHADAGRLDAADARLVSWLVEAKAWAGAKAAYDTLMSGSPDEAKLKALADAPGGKVVMDALVADLPPEASQRVMSKAMKARFGIKVSSFEKAGANAEDLSAAKPVDPAKADKSVQKMYQVLSEVPVDLKGKVTDVIDYKKKGAGAEYGLNKKIYMYCGRPDDPKNKNQVLGKDGEVVPKGEVVDEACKPVDSQPVPLFDFVLLHEAGHAEDDAANFMTNRLGAGQLKFGGWELYRNSAKIPAQAAADHFKYDFSYVLATLSTPKSVPPKKAPKPPNGRSADEWEQARKAVLDWCKLVRTGASPWDKPSLAKQLAIAGRVYQESYDGEWVSYAYAARAQGITSYQFRSQMEWFAELYAAYFSGKLKDNHPSVDWLSKFKKPTKAA